MDDIKLYMAPGTCARVVAVALEEAGATFETVLVRFMKGEHRSPEYLALNPKGKVPTLLIDGLALTENVAIALYLAERFPDKQLLPDMPDAARRAQVTADLCYCAATLHPIVTRIRIPQFFAAPEAAGQVWQAGCDAMAPNFEMIDRRLGEGPWWYGSQWTTMDAYLHWIFWRVAGADFDVGPYPNFRTHAERMVSRPSVKKAMQHEVEATAALEAEGLAWTPPPFEKPAA